MKAGLIGVLLLALTLAVFAQVRGFDFVNYDDRDYVYGNERVLRGLDGEGFVWAHTSTLHHWHPLTWLSLMLDSDLYGAESGAGGYHTTNLALHVLNTLLLFGLLRRLTGSAWKSFFAAALFAVHPLHVEPVAWISSRKDMLSAFFGLLALHAYATWVRRRTALGYVAVATAYLASLLSKQMLVTLPFALLLLDVWPLGRLRRLSDWRPLVLEKLPLLGIAAAFSVAAYLGLSGAGAVQTAEDLPYGLRLANALLAYGTYLVDTVWPQGLACFYPHPAGDMPWVRVVLSTAALAAVSALAFAFRERHPYVLVGWLWYLGTLVPVIGLIQLGGFQRADRYTYLPLIGIFVAAVWLLDSVVPAGRPWRRILPLAGALALLGLVLVSRAQTAHWRNSETLFTHAIAVTRNNDLAYYNLGTHVALLGRHREAIEHLTRAVELNPANADAFANLGNLLRIVGDPAGATANLEHALELAPSMLSARMNLGLIHQQAGRHADAIDSFRRGLELAPGDPRVRETLAGALLGEGRRALERGDRDAAIRHLEDALQVAPEMQAARDALNRLRFGGAP